MQKTKILIVDDDKNYLDSMLRTLRNPKLDFDLATSGKDALSLLEKHEYALILLDVSMLGFNGFKVAEAIRSSTKSQHIPIIFITGNYIEEHFQFKGYELGAIDYLFKPVNSHILKSKIDVLVKMHELKVSLQQEMEKYNT